jgi:hypothetical protein
MQLARRNVQAAGLDARIELRQHGIEALADENAFALVWLPGPFLPAGLMSVALARTLRALEPGAWAILGLFAGAEDPLAILVTDLRTIRSGGQVLAPDAACTLLERAGFSEVVALPRTWQAPALLIAGRKR